MSACEKTNKKIENKKPELSSYEKWAATAFNSWTSYVLVVNLPESTSSYNKKCFRKALAYSIDREKLFDQLTRLLDAYPIDSNGNYLGGPGVYGIVPPAFTEYDIKTITGYSLNKDSAVYYLKKSKCRINNLKNKLELCKGGNDTGIDYMPTMEISKSWVGNIGLSYVYTNVVTRETRNNRTFSGEDGIYLIPIEKYENPEEYLALFYSKNDSLYPLTDSKQKAYKSSLFDTYYEAGLNASRRFDAITNFKAAEQVLIDDAVVIPLFYSKYVF